MIFPHVFSLPHKKMAFGEHIPQKAFISESQHFPTCPLVCKPTQYGPALIFKEVSALYPKQVNKHQRYLKHGVRIRVRLELVSRVFYLLFTLRVFGVQPQRVSLVFLIDYRIGRRSRHFPGLTSPPSPVERRDPLIIG